MWYPVAIVCYVWCVPVGTPVELKGYRDIRVCEQVLKAEVVKQGYFEKVMAISGDVTAACVPYKAMKLNAAQIRNWIWGKVPGERA